MFNKKISAVWLSAILITTTACDQWETAERYYPNYEQLGKADEPGNWVPSFIPRSAVEIKAKYKIDTGAELLTFYFGEPKELSLSGHCKKVATTEVEFPASGFLGVAWWPESLFGGKAKSEALTHYEFYRCERQAFLAVTRADNRHQAFYWRISLN